MSKINVKNIVLILGVSMFDIGAGLYDRLNGVGVLNSVLNLSGFMASEIKPFGGMWGSAGIVGIALVTGIVFYLVLSQWPALRRRL